MLRIKSIPVETEISLCFCHKGWPRPCQPRVSLGRLQFDQPIHSLFCCCGGWRIPGRTTSILTFLNASCTQPLKRTLATGVKTTPSFELWNKKWRRTKNSSRSKDKVFKEQTGCSFDGALLFPTAIAVVSLGDGCCQWHACRRAFFWYSWSVQPWCHKIRMTVFLTGTLWQLHTYNLWRRKTTSKTSSLNPGTCWPPNRLRMRRAERRWSQRQM